MARSNDTYRGARRNAARVTRRERGGRGLVSAFMARLDKLAQAERQRRMAKFRAQIEREAA